jgi:hypothetical protein
MGGNEVHFVRIEGRYASKDIDYDSYEAAVLGKERALNKIAFVKSTISLGVRHDCK